MDGWTIDVLPDGRPADALDFLPTNGLCTFSVPDVARPPPLHQRRRLRVGPVRPLDGAGPVRGWRRDAEQVAGGAGPACWRGWVAGAAVTCLIVPSCASRSGVRAAPTRQPQQLPPRDRPGISPRRVAVSASARFERGTASARPAAAAGTGAVRRRRRSDQQLPQIKSQEWRCGKFGLREMKEKTPLRVNLRTNAE